MNWSIVTWSKILMNHFQHILIDWNIELCHHQETWSNMSWLLLGHVCERKKIDWRKTQTQVEVSNQFFNLRLQLCSFIWFPGLQESCFHLPRPSSITSIGQTNENHLNTSEPWNGKKFPIVLNSHTSPTQDYGTLLKKNFK